MSYLDALVFGYREIVNAAGAALTRRSQLKFAGDGVAVTDSGGQTVVTVSATSAAEPVPVTPTDADYTILTANKLISIPAITAPRNYALPVSPTAGQKHRVVDATGICGTYSVTITPGGGETIDGETSWFLTEPFAVFEVTYMGSSRWKVTA